MARTALQGRTPGRPREFDVDDVLDRAIDVFREYGYEGSSMSAIERATGLNTSSVYNTFGSKQALFRRSLDRYETVRLASIYDVLSSGTEGLADLQRALEFQHAESRSDWGRGGCLAVNAMIELGPRAGETKDTLAEFRRRMGDAIRLPLDRAVALGEMDAAAVPSAVALLVSLTLAVGVLMRSGASDDELAAHFAAAQAAVESWKIRA